MTVKAELPATPIEDMYRALPSVSELLQKEPIQSLLPSYAHAAVVHACRAALSEMRAEIAKGIPRDKLAARLDALPQIILNNLTEAPRYSLRPVVNATGVLLHTNLGRAPLSRKALEHAVEVACGYSNLEFDLDNGERDQRDVHVELLLLQLIARYGSGVTRETHRAIVVNNCAAATFLALHALAKGKEVVVSRGELVEIGGGFRVPEILQESGALIREVGTTNKTRAIDYEHAVTPNTALILRVHQSNFSMEGFVERPSLEDVVALGKRANIPVFEDHGTGLFVALDPHGIAGEPTLPASIRAGCDLVAASGDKLFGGPQCGILIGRKRLVDQIRKDPLFRTYRVDKLTYAALEATLHQYLAAATDEIPSLHMLGISADEIAQRCRHVCNRVENANLHTEFVETESAIGGGTTPKARLKSFAIALKHASHNANELLRTLRQLDPPVIARIEDGQVLLDLRTVEPERDDFLINALNRLSFSDSARGHLQA